MATSISDFDLFSLVENLISEEQVSKEEVPTEKFEKEAEKLKIQASKTIQKLLIKMKKKIKKK